MTGERTSIKVPFSPSRSYGSEWLGESEAYNGISIWAAKSSGYATEVMTIYKITLGL